MNESWSTVSEPVSLPSCGQSVSSNVNRLSLQLQHFNYLQSDNAVFVFSGEPSDDKSLLLKVGCHTCIQLLWNSLWTHVPFFYKYRVTLSFGPWMTPISTWIGKKCSYPHNKLCDITHQMSYLIPMLDGFNVYTSRMSFSTRKTKFIWQAYKKWAPILCISSLGIDSKL